LINAFENPRIIFISRCGVDAVHSIDLWSKRLGVNHTGGVDDWWGRDDIKWHYFRQQILLVDPQYNSVKECATNDLDHVNRAALEWVVTMQEGLHYLTKYPDSIHHIVYEELVENPEQELSAIFDHCDLPTDNSVLEYAADKLYKNISKSWPDLLPPIEKLFYDTMKQLNYDPVKYEKK
jgi:hypothetical protein